MTDTPHPVSLETAFRFARHLRHHEFRQHVWSLAPKGCPVVCTREGEDPATLDARVRDALADHPGYDTALVVQLDDTQRWGLRIDTHPAASRPSTDTEEPTDG